MRKIFSMATISEREKNLEIIVPNISKQAELFYVNLVGYDKIPNILLKYENIIINRFKNKGAEAKFTNYQDINNDDYFFTIDDDILYPDNYSDVMITNMKKYNNKAVCCVHGSNINMNQTSGFHKYNRKLYHFISELGENKQVMIPGTGTACFFKKNFQLNFEEMETFNMVDPYIGCFLHEQKILIYAIKRNAYWLKPIITQGREIFGSNPNKEIDLLYLKTFKK